MKSIVRFCLLLSLSISLCAVCSAQDSSQWQRYAGNDEEFSALLPDVPSVSEIFRPVKGEDKPQSGRMYASYSDGVIYLMVSLDNPDKKDALDVFISEFPKYPVFNSGFKFEREVTLNGFKGKQYSLTSDTANGKVLFYMTDKRVYIFEVVSADLSKPSVNKFLKSLTLDGKSKGKDLAMSSQNADVSTIPASSVPLSEQIANQSIAEKIYKHHQVTRKALMVVRPEPQYTEEARKNQVSGTVAIRAILSSSGKVTYIEIYMGLPHGLTESAVAAVRQMKFLPATKDGKFVSQQIHTEYNFNLD